MLFVVGTAIWLHFPWGRKLGQSGDPGPTAFMRAAQCPHIERIYRPLSELEPRLVCAVVYAEDGRFFRHRGIDWRALRRAATENWREGRIVRGASTIPMQLARNLYLSAERSIGRKVSEMVIATRLARSHERLRLLEVYLNSAEWAPCVYGAEAGARHHLGRSADHLDLAEATFLSVLLPRPAHPPGSIPSDRATLGRRQREIVEIMRHHDLLSEDEEQRALAQVDRMWREGWRGRRAPPVSPAPLRWYGHGCGDA